jgi:hypothetical protein
VHDGLTRETPTKETEMRPAAIGAHPKNDLDWDEYLCEETETAVTRAAYPQEVGGGMALVWCPSCHRDLPDED